MTHDESASAVPRRNSTAIEQVRVLATVWDDLIRVPVLGRRIGVDAVIGLIPGVGDVIAAAVASWAVVVGYRAGAPASVLVRMAGNIAVDTLIGAIPLLGDLFDIGWRAQRRNVHLLDRWLATPDTVRRSSRAILVAIAGGALAVVVAACWMAVVVVRWMFQV